MILEFIRTTDVGERIPATRADAESEASTAEQECPREDCGCDPGAIEAEGSEAAVPQAAFGLERFLRG